MQQLNNKITQAKFDREKYADPIAFKNKQKLLK